MRELRRVNPVTSLGLVATGTICREVPATFVGRQTNAVSALSDSDELSGWNRHGEWLKHHQAARDPPLDVSSLAAAAIGETLLFGNVRVWISRRSA
jgi:hypothetical protein